MGKYLDKSAIALGLGAIVGGAIFTMFIADKLPRSVGGNK